MANKLELTWYGKDEPIRVEPRLLIENAELSNTAADPGTENMLIHGDNLLALKALESDFAGQVKCVYIEETVTEMIRFLDGSLSVKVMGCKPFFYFRKQGCA